jgi:hypothetical protein
MTSPAMSSTERPFMTPPLVENLAVEVSQPPRRTVRRRQIEKHDSHRSVTIPTSPSRVKRHRAARFARKTAARRKSPSRSLLRSSSHRLDFERAIHRPVDELRDPQDRNDRSNAILLVAVRDHGVAWLPVALAGVDRAGVVAVDPLSFGASTQPTIRARRPLR